MGRTFLGSFARSASNLVARTPGANPPIPYPSRARERALPFMSNGGTEAEMRAMGAVGTLFSIVNRTSTSTSLVDWKLWRKAPSGKKEDRVEVTSHAALDLWNRPNAFMPRQELVEVTQQHIDLTGEGWWVIGYSGRSSIPLELWPVRPDRMTPVPSRDKFLAGYVYTSPDGEQIPLDLDQVVFIRMPNPLDPYRGMGPVQSVLADLDATRYSAEWNRNFFLNSAEPGGIIEVPQALSDPDFDQLRDRWNEQHRGVANAHRVAILEHGKWVDRKLSQRDMQFAELRTVSRDVLREAFGISAFALGDVQDVNRATADAAKAWFGDQMTVPRLERFKSALNNELLPQFGPTTRGLEYDYESPVQPDPQAEAEQLLIKAQAVQALVASGFDPQSLLAALGLPESIEFLKTAPAPAPLRRPLPPVQDPNDEPNDDPADGPVDAWEQARANILGEDPEDGLFRRWTVKAEVDGNTCEPCKANDGHVYNTRRAAYKDYPGGTSYVHCVGEEYGNQCRCKVVKRGRKTKGEEDDS